MGDNVSRSRFPHVVYYEDVSWLRKRVRSHDVFFFVADEVLVPVATGQIVFRASSRGPVLTGLLKPFRRGVSCSCASISVLQY